MDSTRRFGPRARAYAEFRPSYPVEAIDAVLEGLGDPHALTVADVGAGTGIASRLLAKRGAAVIAVEPDPRMRAQAEHHTGITWCEGTAERTGLADGCVDLVLACQAFHWFATSAAMREFRRIARRRAAILQYERDERDAFTHAYGDLVRAYATDDTEARRARALTIFGSFPNARIARRSFSSRQSLDRAGLVGRAGSSSYLPSTGAEADALRRDLEGLFERFARGGRVELVTVTHVIVADW